MLFEITDQNFHGVPATVNCPDGRARCSFVAYYHTAGVNDSKSAHTSIYAPSIYQPKKSFFRKFAKEVTPPVVHRALHLLKKNSRRNGKNGNR